MIHSRVSKKFICLLGIATIFCSSTAIAQSTPSQEEMWKMIQAQQKKIEYLTKELEATKEQTEAVTEIVEARNDSTNSENNSPAWWQNTQLGGYGELHYNGGDKDEIDFHRFVLLIGHQFNDFIRLYSEIELEHSVSGDDQEGEVELEQAYIEFDIAEDQHIKAGVFLIPVGMLNERHEPTTFFGVERNAVETNIIPTTWWEAGLGFAGELPADFKYDLAFHSGLETPTDGDNAYLIRKGRQKVAKASAKDGAVTARLRWTGMPGVELGVSGQYQNDITQRTVEEDVSALLLSSHLDLRKGPFGFRALYAHWDLDGDTPKENGRDEQEGWFVEPGYYISSPIGEWGIFGRYSRFDNESGDSTDSEYQQIDTGINYWPHPQVVLKADMAFIDAPTGEENDNILNLGIGFTY